MFQLFEKSIGNVDWNNVKQLIYLNHIAWQNNLFYSFKYDINRKIQSTSMMQIYFEFSG